MVFLLWNESLQVMIPTSIHWPFANASGFPDAFAKASGTPKPKLEKRTLTLGLLFYCRTIVAIVAATIETATIETATIETATIETIVRHSTPKLNCVEALVLCPDYILGWHDLRLCEGRGESHCPTPFAKASERATQNNPQPQI